MTDADSNKQKHEPNVASDSKNVEITAYLTDILKEIIIRNLETALIKHGLEPNKVLMQKLRAASYEAVARAATGFPGYLISELIKKIDPEARIDEISLL